ncbi:Sialic acid TRAP transporter permease protein SiaT [Sporomusa silvacetica DSM 10669]|uniref:Sialic acid TRAP transporter permease protein SiaT n=1 Tax=Sporomusa silvacetica DSM 10669 TaxID=1123289 RepID=A0ABZ3IV52_9FIRM|nr:TRAP transporter large permease subunit [Sporomusa silvacetica]OZC21177.1 sialic acid TRAP transporter permease protein SiaT [Sporomusa silvacetica DSM 10669]
MLKTEKRETETDILISAEKSIIKHGIDKILDALVGISVIAELVILFGNIVAREVFGVSLLWANELGQLSLTFIAFLGGALAYNRNEHIAVHAVIERLPQSWKPSFFALVDWLVFAGSIIGAYLSIEIINSRWEELSSVLEISMGWFVLPLLLGMTLMAIFALLRLKEQKRFPVLVTAVLVLVTAGIIVWFNEMWGPFGTSHLVNWITMIAFVVQMAVGLPVGFVLAIVSILYLYLSGSGDLMVVPMNMQAGVSNFVLLSIPFFMFAGYVMTEGGLSRRLADFVVSVVGRVQGGLYQVIVVTMYVFSGLSGSKAADVAAVGATLDPMLRDKGYDPAESAAILSASAVMGETIPPSLPMLVLGSITTVSMGALFMAGLLPALVIALCLMVTIYIKARRSKKYAGTKIPFSETVKCTVAAIPALLVPALLVVGIVSGIATPTEISAVAVVYAIVLATFFYREMTWQKFWKTVSDTAVKSGMILFITSTASAFSWTLTAANIPQTIAELMVSVAGHTDWLFMIATVVILVVMGALLEGLPALLVFAPILMPLAPIFGITTLQYGIVLLLAMGLGCFFPIIGVGIYIACSVTNTKVEDTSHAMMPYVVVLFIGLLLVAFVPWFSLVMPQMMHLI